MRIALALLLLVWPAWVFGHLLLMLLFRPDQPNFNGFSIDVPDWCRALLDEEELAAIVAHEEGHRELGHVWENFSEICAFRRQTIARRAQQEYDADDYADSLGHGPALARALRKLGKDTASAFDNVRARRLELRACKRYFDSQE